MGFYSDLAGHYDRVFPFRETVASFLADRLPATGSILDLGCGTGEYCAHLDTPQRPCLGLDPDPEMIRVARERHPSCAFATLGLQEVGSLYPRTFGGAFSIGNVVAHLDGEALGQALGRLGRVLSPGAVWVVQTVNFDRLQGCDEHVFPVKVLDPGDASFERRYERQGPGRYLFHTRLTCAGKVVYAGSTPLFFHTSADLVRLHRSAGFTLLERSGDFTGSGFEPEKSAGLVLVFRWQEEGS